MAKTPTTSPNLSQEITSTDVVDFFKVSHSNDNTNNHNLNSNVNNLANKKMAKATKCSSGDIGKGYDNSTKENLIIFGFNKRNKYNEEKFKIEQNNKKQEKETETATATDSTSVCSHRKTPQTPGPIGTPPRRHKVVKSSPIFRLLGNTYHNTKKMDKEKKVSECKFNTFDGRRRTVNPYLERFKRYARDDGNLSTTEWDTNGKDTLDRQMFALEHFQEPHAVDLGSKALRTLSRGLGKLWWKRTHSVEISTPDPEFKVSYLGNILTGWAKGEGCVDKQLSTLWRNYTQNNKPDVTMRLKVCASGLKATTRQHGLTEYWANRITHCCAPKNYPRVFCWIYRHEGRKLRHELRCHAVLCSKEKQVKEICDTLKTNLECALREFKREKILKQNARLSLANAVYDNPSLPRRKILLSVGSNNYRPPLERSKSAPKLMAIEEAIGEEGEEIEETNEPEMKPCCQKDSLYPAMTLGRRRCRKGHSIRRTGRLRPVSYGSSDSHFCGQPDNQTLNKTKETKEATREKAKKQAHNNGSSNSMFNDSDDFDKILKHHDYDSNASLPNDLLPYIEIQLNKNISNICGILNDLTESEMEEHEESLSLLPCISNDPNANALNDFNPNNLMKNCNQGRQQLVALRRSGVSSDGEDDFLGKEEEDMYFRQAAILNMLHRHSMRKMANLSLSSDEGSSSLETTSSGAIERHYKHQQQSSMSSEVSPTSVPPQHSVNNRISGIDSADEGSISSGCETASTVTNNQNNIFFNYGQALRQFQNDSALEENSLSMVNCLSLTNEEIFECLQNRNNDVNGDGTTFSSSSSITLKIDSSPTNSIHEFNLEDANLTQSNSSISAASSQRPRRMRQRDVKHDSDSEHSDESGYVEFQEREKFKNNIKNNSYNINNKTEQPKPQIPVKPQIPPKPMPRRLINMPGNTKMQPTTTF